MRSFLEGLGYPIEKPAVGDEAVYGVVWLAEHAHRWVAEVMRRFHLTPVKFNVLMVVKHIGKSHGLSHRDISRRLLIKKGNLTPLLKDLERHGWLARTPDADRRVRRIVITHKGDQLLNDTWPVYKQAMHRLTRGLPRSSQRRLVELLGQWRNTLQE